MSNKTLKIKRVFLYAIYNSLRQTPPKDYPTVAEIKSTINAILPALKEAVTGYIELFTKVQDLAEQVREKKLSEEESKAKVDAMNDQWKEYNTAHGNEVVDIVLDDESFKTFKAQFERDKWGKNWLANIEEFGELAAAFDEAAK